MILIKTTKVLLVITLCIWISIPAMTYANIWIEDIKVEPTTVTWKDGTEHPSTNTYDAFPHHKLADTIEATISFAILMSVITFIFLIVNNLNQDEEPRRSVTS
jgi:hypothetical protein